MAGDVPATFGTYRERPNSVGSPWRRCSGMKDVYKWKFL